MGQKERKVYVMSIVTLTGDQRNSLRKAITSHVDWPNYRNVIRKSIADLSREELLLAAETLKIDVKAIIDNGNSNATESNTMKERSIPESMIESLKNRYVASSLDMTNSGKEMIESIFRSIDTKQDGKATQRQFDVINDIISKAEKAMADRASSATSTAKPIIDKNPAGEAIWDLVKGHALDSVWQNVEPMLQRALSNVSTVRIELTSSGVAVGSTDGHQHPMFGTLCKLLSARAADGFVPNVWIAGPAGSGKTHAVKSFAKAAGLDFYYNGALRDAFELLGYKDANGHYHATAFRKAFEHGGVYLFDEVDGSDNAALLALNGALANGVASFPDGIVERHKDCRIVATGNTWGLGATADYVGRSKIDAAFLDRFGASLQWGYDTALESAICGNPDFAKRVQAARVRAQAAGLKVLITPRASIAGAAYIAAGMTHDEAANLTYLAKLSEEQKKIVEGRA